MGGKGLTGGAARFFWHRGLSLGGICSGGAALQAEQRLLHFQAAGVAHQLAVGADDPVAGDHYSNWVPVIGHPYGPAGVGVAHCGGDLFIGSGLPIGDFAQRLPYTLLEVGTG